MSGRHIATYKPRLSTDLHILLTGDNHLIKNCPSGLSKALTVYHLIPFCEVINSVLSLCGQSFLNIKAEVRINLMLTVVSLNLTPCTFYDSCVLHAQQLLVQLGGTSWPELKKKQK